MRLPTSEMPNPLQATSHSESLTNVDTLRTLLVRVIDAAAALYGPPQPELQIPGSAEHDFDAARKEALDHLCDNTPMRHNTH